jgi:hypothetical protein
VEAYLFKMKYFLHDTNSFDDEKITELYLKFGYEGLGLFYTTLEKMSKQEKPVKTDILKAQLRVGKRLNKCWIFMEEIGLISSNNGESFNKQLLNFSEKYQIKKEKTRKKVQEWRERQENKEIVTSYVPVSNLPKVKESKVNKKEVIKKSYTAFYESELLKTEDENYHRFVKWLLGENEIGEPFVKCLSLKNQIGYKQFLNLRQVAEKYGTLLVEKIKTLENRFDQYKPTSLSLTLNTWLKKKY